MRARIRPCLSVRASAHSSGSRGIPFRSSLMHQIVAQIRRGARPALWLFLACGIALGTTGCGRKDAAPQSGQQGNAPLAVTTQRVTAKPQVVVLNTVGRTEGSKEVELRARVSGILKK